MRMLTLLSKIDKIVEKHFIAAFWNDLAKYLKRAEQMAQKNAAGTLYGTKVSLEKTCDGIKVISRHYLKGDQGWDETVISKIMSEYEVPYAIAVRISPNEELDVTEELEMRMADS